MQSFALVTTFKIPCVLDRSSFYQQLLLFSPQASAEMRDCALTAVAHSLAVGSTAMRRPLAIENNRKQHVDTQACLLGLIFEAH